MCTSENINIFPMSTSFFAIRSKRQLKKDHHSTSPCHHQHEQEYRAQHCKKYAPSPLLLLVSLSALSIIFALFISISYHCVVPICNGGCLLGSIIRADTSDFFFFVRRKKQILTNKYLFPTTTATFVHAFSPTSIPLHRRWIHTSSPPPPSSSARLYLRRPPGNSIDYNFHQHQRQKELQAFSTPKNETSNASLDAMEEKEEEINSIPRLPDFQKWNNMSLPNVTAAVSLPSLPKMPPLPNINITMPKVDLDFDLLSDQNFLIADKFRANKKRNEGDKTAMKPTTTSTSTPIVEVISEQPQRFRSLKLKIPTVNMRDIPRPWTRYYDSSIDTIDRVPANAEDGNKNDNGQVVIDVGAVLDLSDTQSERENQRPLDLFGALPDLEFNLNLQFDTWWKNGKEQGSDSEDSDPDDSDSESESESDSSKASPPPHKNTQRLLLDTLTSSICKVTGKDTYQFGDITRYIDSCAKDTWNEIQLDARDLAQQLDHEMDEKIQEISFTRGQMQENVQNVTRTLIRKVASEEYQLSEITFLCKVLMALGADFAPVAGVLPVKLLLELFGYSIACGIAERFFTAIITELDRRLERNEEVKALPGVDEDNKDDVDGVNIVDTNIVSPLSSRKQRGFDNKNYAPGDLTKQAILEYTGKESYEVGNIAEKQRQEGIIERVDDDRASIDVIGELEECLKMERELVEKLNRVRTLTSKT